MASAFRWFTGPALEKHGRTLLIEEQLAIFDALADRAFELVVDDMMAAHVDILRVARERFTQGAATFGSEMFRKHPNVLYEEERQELADSICYRIAAMWLRERQVTTL